MTTRVDDEAPRGAVDAVLRALRVLETLVDRPDGLGVSEVAAEERVNKALAYRALTSLVVAGWASQDAQDRYHLTGRLLRLGGHWYRGLGLAQLALPTLQPLADRTACHIEVTWYFEGALRVMLVAEPSRFPTGLRLVSHVGDIQTPYATAAGKVWLASLGPAEFERYLTENTLSPITPQTITDRALLRAEIEHVRGARVAFNRCEDSDGVFAVAVPIPRSGARDQAVAILGLGRPSAAVTAADESGLTEEARRAAAELGEVLPIWEPLPR